MKYPDPKRVEKLQAFDRLLTIMDELRNECPWDKKQTIASLRHLTIEETFELADAIMENDLQEVKKEIGDILLHLVFYAKIASETNDFDITDVINSLCDKMTIRHPHIYGDTKVENEEDVKRNWEQIKLKEGGEKTVLGGVPNSLPALLKAIRIQDKARGAGFDWDNTADVWAKVKEELQEFEDEFLNTTTDNSEAAEAEFGDLLFSLVNFARFSKINPETALEKTNRKFIRRFNYLENQAKVNNQVLEKMTLAEMDLYWDEAKKLGL